MYILPYCSKYMTTLIIRRLPLFQDVPFGKRLFDKKKKSFYVKIIFYTAYFSYLKCCIESMVNTVKMYQRSHSKINTCFCSDVFLRKKHHLIFGTIRYCRHNKMNSMLMLYHELSANEMLLNGGGAVLASVCLSNASSHIM